MISNKKIALVIGANRGIGFAAAGMLAKGFIIIITGRNIENGHLALEKLKKYG